MPPTRVGSCESDTVAADGPTADEMALIPKSACCSSRGRVDPFAPGRVSSRAFEFPGERGRCLTVQPPVGHDGRGARRELGLPSADASAAVVFRIRQPRAMKRLA
jgi:hypothetical protein